MLLAIQTISIFGMKLLVGAPIKTAHPSLSLPPDGGGGLGDPDDPNHQEQ